MNTISSIQTTMPKTQLHPYLSAISTTGEWHFNLNTKDQGMSKGIWQIKVTLSDGSIHTAFIELK
jgi:hypothetical protein